MIIILSLGGEWIPLRYNLLKAVVKGGQLGQAPS